MAVCEKRIGELETLITKIYEDNVLGKLSDKSMAEKEPTLEELEEMRKKEARKDRLHQNCWRQI